MTAIRKNKAWAVFALLLFCTSHSFAGYFLEMQSDEPAVVDARPLPFFLVGAGASLDYYFNSFDGGFQALGEFRLHEKHSVNFFGAIPVSGDFYELGLGYRFFFSGNLMGMGHDDFLSFGVSSIIMEKEDEVYFPPTLSVGYGRDILFFKNSDFMGRIEVRASYIIGEPLSEKVENLPMTEDTHFIAYMQFSLLFF